MTSLEPDPQTLLAVKGLKVYFPAQNRVLSRVRQFVRAVDDVSFRVAPGETLGLVGESGCGKTTVARAVVRLVEPTSGSIVFQGRELTELRGAKLRSERRGFQMIFQDSFGSLDPRIPAGETIGEALDIHQITASKGARSERILTLLKGVGLGPEHLNRSPRELSGGQRQRVGIARALAVEPRLLVCDEALSALDVSVQAQILNLLKDLQQRHGLAYLFIAHDLAAVGHLSHRIMVMYLGKVVELARSKVLLNSPRHPYTLALISAVPTVDASSNRPRLLLSGDIPSPVQPPAGCPFHPRCPRAEFPRCQAEPPPLREVAPGHWAACHFA